MKSISKDIFIGYLPESSIDGYFCIVFWTKDLLTFPLMHDSISTDGKMHYSIQNQEGCCV